MSKISNKSVKNIFKKRPLSSKKYDFGNLLVIGGSEFYSGTPALAALAAFRSGADMVKIIAPKRAADIAASFSPILSAYPLEGNWIEEKHLAKLVSLTKAAEASSGEKTAVVIGGGAGRDKSVQETILKYLSSIEVPAVIDADAIYASARNLEAVSGKNFVFTPHSHEFFILTGKDLKNKSRKEKREIVKKEAKRIKATILLKGETDIISDGNKAEEEKGGSPFMTVGGTGDVVAGICGALLARGANTFEAAQAAVFISAKAGEAAAKEKGEAMVATDVIEKISEAISGN